MPWSWQWQLWTRAVHAYLRRSICFTLDYITLSAQHRERNVQHPRDATCIMRSLVRRISSISGSVVLLRIRRLCFLQKQLSQYYYRHKPEKGGPKMIKIVQAQRPAVCPSALYYPLNHAEATPPYVRTGWEECNSASGQGEQPNDKLSTTNG